MPSLAAGGWGTLHHRQKTAHALGKQEFGKGRDEPSPDVLKLKWKIPPRRAGSGDVPCAAAPNLLLASFSHRQGSLGWKTRENQQDRGAGASCSSFRPGRDQEFPA